MPFNRDIADKLRVRRHIALLCLLLNSLILLTLLAAIFYGPPDRHQVIASATQILLAISALTGGFTAAWFHAAFRSDQAHNPQ